MLVSMGVPVSCERDVYVCMTGHKCCYHIYSLKGLHRLFEGKDPESLSLYTITLAEWKINETINNLKKLKLQQNMPVLMIKCSVGT